MIAEYIDREALKKKIELRIKSWSRDCNSKAPAIVNTYKEILHELKYIPTADVVEVVRCKDCRMFVENKEAFVAYCKRELKNLCVNPNDYCSYGEKRSEEE